MKPKTLLIALSVLLALSLITPSPVIAKGKPPKPPKSELYTIIFSGTDMSGTTEHVQLDSTHRSCNGLHFTIQHETMATEDESLSGYSTERGWLVWYMDKGGKAMVRITFYLGEPQNWKFYHLYVWEGEYTKVGGDRWSITTFDGSPAKLYRDYGDISNLVFVWEGTATFTITRSPEF